jgi:hypothetical protein
MTEYPAIPTHLLVAKCDARENAYRVVSESDFYPLPGINVVHTNFLVPEMAVVTANYMLFGTPVNGARVYFERPLAVDGNEQQVMRNVIVGIKLALDEELSELPDVVERIRELESLLAGGRP